MPESAPQRAPDSNSSASASAMLFESQGSMMLRMAMGGNSLPNEQDSAEITSSSSGDIRLLRIRESQLEEFPTAPSIRVDLETFSSAEQSYASVRPTTRVSATSSSEGNAQEQVRAILGIGEDVNDRQRTVAVTRDFTGDATNPRTSLPPPNVTAAASAAPMTNMPPPKVPARSRSLHLESRQNATRKRCTSLESVDSLIGDQEPRSAGDYIRQRTRAEKEAERPAKPQRTFHLDARHAPHSLSVPKRPQSRGETRENIPSKEKDKENCVVDVEGDNASSSESWGKIPPSPKVPLVDNGPSLAQGKILVEATPSNTNTSISRSSDISSQPQPTPARYPPGTGPSNPPFMRPSSSLDTSSRPWTEVPQPVSDPHERRTQESPEIPGPQDILSSAPPPRTPERRTEGALVAANNLITPTQPSIAPAPRLRAREVDADTLSRMRSNTTASDIAARSMGSEESPGVVPESKDSTAADDGVKVSILLPAFTPVSKGKGVDSLHSEQRVTDRPSKRRRTDPEPPGNSPDGPESPSPAERSATRKRTRRASLPVSSSLPVTPPQTSKAASMKRKAPSSPANEPGTQDEDDERDEEDEAEVSQTEPEAPEGSEASESNEDESSSSERDNDGDEDYVLEESQIPGPGTFDGFGIKRKRGSYASVSPAKSSRKRARMRAEQETSPTEGKSVPRPTIAPKAKTQPGDILRVFAPWHRNNQYYLGRVIARTKKEEYEVLFDDGETSRVLLSKLRSEVMPGDRVKIMSRGGKWAEVISVSWRKRGGQYITAKMERGRESVTVPSRFIVVPKDTWPQDRHISLKDIPQAITKAIPSPLRLRSKPTSVIHPPLTPTKVKVELRSIAPPKSSPMHPQRKVPSPSRGTKLHPQASVVSFPGSEVARVPPTQIKQAFARTIMIMTGIEDKLKHSLIPRIRRGGGKIVENWLDILTFGDGRSHMKWRGIAKEGDVDQILLLSPEANQFPKYMMALAIGVPCISIQWVLDRLEGVDVSWHGYLHIAGKSERRGQFVSQVFDPRWGQGRVTDLTPAYPIRQPFQNLGFLLVFPSKQEWRLRQDARRVICAAGAESAELILSVDQAKEPVDSYDFVVTDTDNNSFMASLQEAGAKKCVNTVWIRQCIITGALQPVY